MPRGLNLNNGMNIMHNPNFVWQGEIVPTRDPEGRLCTFDTDVDGIRAGAKDLLSYFNHDGCKTIRQIIMRFAPPPTKAPGDKNPTAAYIAFICTRCGVGPYDLVDMNDQTFLQSICQAIVRFEQGIENAVTSEDMSQGVGEALKYYAS